MYAAVNAPTFTCAGLPGESIADKGSRFLLATLTFAPVEATQAGYHGDAAHPLDSQLDDMSEATLAAERALLKAGEGCFAERRAGTPEDDADMALLQANIQSSLYELDVLQGYHYHPQDYAEMIGSGLFFPLTSTRGTETERLTNVVARMEQVPQVLEQARHQLRETDPIFIDTAVGENAGDIDVVKEVGERIAKDSPLRARYDSASAKALAALEEYARWLKDDLAKRPHTISWRTGPERYAKIFAFALGPGSHETPDTVLAATERDLITLRSEMYAQALPLHKQWFAAHGDHGDLKGDALENKVISEVIDRINVDHCAPGDLLSTVQTKAKDIRDFILKKDLMTLSSRDNLKIVPTPEFMRGVYSVAGFHSAPVLEPAQEAEYWVTPIDPKMTKEQAESKLREYNNWMLQYLTMHEALPGHYTQFEHANSTEPMSRRILRAMLANGAYAEGWGEFAVKEMEEAGYADGDPRFVLMVEKIRLRVITNAMLDIRMQSRGMTDAEAMDLMENKAFQTHAEAEGKLRRAKLTAGQLITYYVGYHQWITLREHEQTRLAAKFNLKKFNDAALDEGPLPIPLLEPLLDKRLL